MFIAYPILSDFCSSGRYVDSPNSMTIAHNNITIHDLSVAGKDSHPNYTITRIVYKIYLYSYAPISVAPPVGYGTEFLSLSNV